MLNLKLPTVNDSFHVEWDAKDFDSWFYKFGPNRRYALYNKIEVCFIDLTLVTLISAF